VTDHILRLSPARRRPGDRNRTTPEPHPSAAAATGVPSWLIFNFHHICDRCNKYATTREDPAALMEWLTHRPVSTAVRAVGAVMLHGIR
jgi:hypothetical protein